MVLTPPSLFPPHPKIYHRFLAEERVRLFFLLVVFFFLIADPYFLVHFFANSGLLAYIHARCFLLLNGILYDLQLPSILLVAAATRALELANTKPIPSSKTLSR